ncbi:hypothetical protein PWT90_03434 [Aphanocladium album]|nr:hypothetical protein PWT90_03434 [Aphanocladium album]
MSGTSGTPRHDWYLYVVVVRSQYVIYVESDLNEGPFAGYLVAAPKRGTLLEWKPAITSYVASAIDAKGPIQATSRELLESIKQAFTTLSDPTKWLPKIRSQLESEASAEIATESAKSEPDMRMQKAWAERDKRIQDATNKLEEATDEAKAEREKKIGAAEAELKKRTEKVEDEYKARMRDAKDKCKREIQNAGHAYFGMRQQIETGISASAQRRNSVPNSTSASEDELEDEMSQRCEGGRYKRKAAEADQDKFAVSSNDVCELQTMMIEAALKNQRVCEDGIEDSEGERAKRLQEAIDEYKASMLAQLHTSEEGGGMPSNATNLCQSNGDIWATGRATRHDLRFARYTAFFVLAGSLSNRIEKLAAKGVDLTAPLQTRLRCDSTVKLRIRISSSVKVPMRIPKSRLMELSGRPFALAIYFSETTMMKAIISQHKEDESTTLVPALTWHLQEACRLGQLDAIALLLESGANPNNSDAIDDSNGLRSCFEIAGWTNLPAPIRDKVVSLLLEKGATPTPLALLLSAKLPSSIAVAEALLSRNVSLDFSTKFGENSLMVAVNAKSMELVRFLLPHVDASRADNWGRTLPIIAAYTGCTAIFDIVTEHIMSKHGNELIEASDRDGRTPLM